MKILINLILIYCLLVSTTYAQSVNPNDQLKLGKPSSVSDKGIVFDTNDGVSNKKLLVEKISKKLKWDGNSVQIGDGSSSSDKELIIAGALKSLKYNGTTGEFEFNDDVKLSASLKTDFLQAVNTEVAINSLLRATQGIKVGSGSNEIRVSGGNLEFSNDGTVFKKFGTGTGGGSTGTTILDNASFEDGISTNWTSSGGTFTQGTYTNGVDGNTKYAQFVATGSGQYFETALFYVPTNFSGGCQADFKKVNVSTNDLFKVEVLDSSANVLSSGNVKASSWVKFPTINFTCPTAGTQIKLRVTSLSAGTIQVDDAYLGSNQNIINLSQSRFFGSIRYVGTNNCTWTNTTQTYLNFSPDTDCPIATVSGNASAPATKIPAIVLNNVNSGTYYFIAKGSFNVGGGTGNIQYRFSDGVNSSSGQNVGDTTTTKVPLISGEITYTSFQSSVTVNIQGKAFEAARGAIIQNDYSDLEISVYYFPSSQETAVSPEQASWLIDANIGGANPSLGTSSITSYTEITDAGLDLVINTSKGSSSAEIACINGTSSTGLTCSAVNESVGIAFTPPYSGYFDVCFDGVSSNVTGSGGVNTTFQLVETPNNSTTIIQEGGTRSNRAYNIGVVDTVVSSPVCGTFNFSDTSKRTIRLMREQGVGGAPSSHILLADRSATNGQRDIHITVRPSLSAFNRPILVDNPIVSASYYANTNFTSSTTQPADFNTKIYDVGCVGNCVTTGSSWKFTAPQAGKYHVSTFLSGSPTPATATGVFLYKNGSLENVISYTPSAGATYAHGSMTIDLAIGDYIDIRSGASLTYGGASKGSTASSTIHIERLGK